MVVGMHEQRSGKPARIGAYISGRRRVGGGGGGAAVEVEAGGEEAVLVHGPVGAGAAAAAAGAEDERPLGADGALAARRDDEGLLPGRPPDAGAGRPGRAAALAPAPRRRAVEEEALPVGVGCSCSFVRWIARARQVTDANGSGRAAMRGGAMERHA